MPSFVAQLDAMSLDTVIVPAGNFFNEKIFLNNLRILGNFIVHTFYLKESELLEFYMKHDQEFTMNIFFTPMKRVGKFWRIKIKNLLNFR